MNDNHVNVLVVDEKQVEKNSIILTFLHTTMDKHFSHHSGARAMRELYWIYQQELLHTNSRVKNIAL